jgi:hypothetical protein
MLTHRFRGGQSITKARLQGRQQIGRQFALE